MTKLLAEIAVEFWEVLAEMSPYLVFGFLVAGVLSVLVSPRFIERHLGGHGIWPIFKATIFGVPLPLCSCGVIPVAASLRKHGASRGATAGFLLSTPQTGVDSIFVTLSLLGPVFAIFRPLAALVSGLVGGSLVSLFGTPDTQTPDLPSDAESSKNAEEEAPGNRIVRVLKYGFVTLPQDIGRPMFLGLIIAGIISAVIPQDFFMNFLGDGILAKLVMMAVGIPIYVCATASVPVAAALVAKGMSPGAALVFLMTGPATNAAAITVLWKMLGKRTAVIYLGTVAALSLVFGVLLDAIFAIEGSAAGPAMGWMMPRPVKIVCAIVMLALLLRAVAGSLVRRPAGSIEAKEGTMILNIKGMTCGHCVASVKKALAGMDGVTSVEVDLSGGKAAIEGDGLDSDTLCRTVAGLGYEASVVSE